MCHEMRIYYWCKVCRKELRIEHDCYICPRAANQKYGRIGWCGRIHHGSKDNLEEMCGACAAKKHKTLGS
ncbi:hypothetical protein FALCPG4_017471 [Fusarium falciforme]